ncbi:MAG: signal peptidase II [Erysipelotrichaceae bacterium]|nr:signal peptidase II [Erysipelotrichaceae bacterium]
MKIREIVVILLIVAVDLFSKWYIEAHEALHFVTLIPNFFYLTYAKNTGAAWSMLEGNQLFLKAVTVIALIALFWFLFHTPKDQKVLRWAYCLMIAGALGNFIDRVCYGYVRDFLNFFIFGYDFPIFNIADSSLCIGVFLLIVCIMLSKED